MSTNDIMSCGSGSTTLDTSGSWVSRSLCGPSANEILESRFFSGEETSPFVGGRAFGSDDGLGVGVG